jgi:hypothetical protein
VHRYEVRVSTEPIVDERSFIERGRPAKTASDDAEGAVALELPTDVRPGKEITSAVGDLRASTLHFIAVRAVDRRNRKGPISVASITTTERTFSTVTPCFVASAVYGSPLAREVSVLRRLRDRHLQSNELGRGLIRAYYAVGEPLAARVREHPWLARAVRAALSPIVAFSRWLLG